MKVTLRSDSLGREEGGSELIANIRVSRSLPVADNWIDEDATTRLSKTDAVQGLQRLHNTYSYS